MVVVFAGKNNTGFNKNACFREPLKTPEKIYRCKNNNLLDERGILLETLRM